MGVTCAMPADTHYASCSVVGSLLHAQHILPACALQLLMQLLLVLPELPCKQAIKLFADVLAASPLAHHVPLLHCPACVAHVLCAGSTPSGVPLSPARQVAANQVGMQRTRLASVCPQLVSEGVGVRQHWRELGCCCTVA